MEFREGDRGPEIRDIQRRLRELGLLPEPLESGAFGPDTASAVRQLQQERGLSATGAVNDDTWRALVEAGWRLGDRLLYETTPMLRGDDIRELQQRLTRLGFDTTWVDGVFGPRTADAIRDFQSNMGLEVDGRAGPAVVEQLRLVARAHHVESVTGVRERHRVGQHGQVGFAGLPVMVDPAHGPDVPGHVGVDDAAEHEITWAIASLVAGRLSALGARPILSRGPTSSPSPTERAELANLEDVAAILSLHVAGTNTPAASGTSAWYFGHATYQSPRGMLLAELCLDAVTHALGTEDCRTHPSTMGILSSSRAPAVAVELGFLSNPHDAAKLTDPERQKALADGLVDALVTFVVGDDVSVPRPA